MYKFVKFVAVFSLILVFLSMPMIVVHAAPDLAPVTQEPTPVTLPDLVRTLETLGGFAMLFASLVNVGKKLGWVQDDQAPAWSLGLNALGLATLVGLQLSGKFDMVPMLDSNAGALAVVINSILGLIFQLYISRKTHESVLAGMPLVGKSCSGRRAGEGPAIEVDAFSD